MKMIETERLLLRPLHIDDSEIIETLAGDYEVAKTTLTIPHPYPAGSAIHFIEGVLEAEKQGRSVFAITLKETKIFIGIMGINVTQAHRRGELAYWVGKPFWGQGYGTEAAGAVMSFGFEQLMLNKIFAQAFTSNPGSWRIMEKIGLKYEGTLKQHFARADEFFDVAQYGLLKEEYTG